MHGFDADGVTTPYNRRKIMRFVHIVHEDSEVRLSEREELFDSGKTFRADQCFACLCMFSVPGRDRLP